MGRDYTWPSATVVPMKTNLGYKVPFRQCFTDRILGKWGLIHYVLYCHVWLRVFPTNLPKIG